MKINLSSSKQHWLFIVLLDIAIEFAAYLAASHASSILVNSSCDESSTISQSLAWILAIASTLIAIFCLVKAIKKRSVWLIIGASLLVLLYITLGLVIWFIAFFCISF